MKTIIRSARTVLGAGAALTVLAACGGSQSHDGQLTPAYRASGAQRSHGARSWMLAGAKSNDLLYLSDAATNTVSVYSYPKLRLVGMLGDLGQPRSECVDKAGDVWIADVESLAMLEYTHGGATPIAALSTPGVPAGCSVDPTTGDLAVSGGLNGVVATVYKDEGSRHGWHFLKYVRSSNMMVAAFCGYDDKGNLFIDGQSQGKGGGFQLVELPRRKSALVTIAIGQAIANPGQVQWDGTYLAVGDAGASPAVLYQFSIQKQSATEVGSTTLNGTGSVAQFWISAGSVVGPDGSNDDVGFWPYPGGGSPAKTIAGIDGYGATISPSLPALR